MPDMLKPDPASIGCTVRAMLFQNMPSVSGFAPVRSRPEKWETVTCCITQCSGFHPVRQWSGQSGSRHSLGKSFWEVLMKAIVYDALPHGRNNAIPWRDLVAQLGFGSKRELQKHIEVERRHGFVILTDFTGKGYFRSDDPDDLKRFIATMNAKAVNTRIAILSAERELNRVSGQTVVDGW